MRAIVAGFLVSSIMAGAAWAQPARHWVAVNRITMEATGDLTLKGGRLSFGTDGSIHVRLVKSHARGRWSETNATEPADIYKVDPPTEPSSSRGDVLCNAPATYIVLSHPLASDLEMGVYTGKAPPKGDGKDEACANFSYTQG